MNFIASDLPVFIQRELEKIHEKLVPIMKKSAKYTLWSFPLIGMSIFNVAFQLLFVPADMRSLFVLILSSVVGALGFALSKEAKFQKRQIRELSSEFMVERIVTSENATEESKSKYVALVKSQPVHAVQHFVEFLKKENQHSLTHDDSASY